MFSKEKSGRRTPSIFAKCCKNYRNIEFNRVCSSSLTSLRVNIKQGSQTSGPRAACGPSGAFVRPALISKTYPMINFHQIHLNFRTFYLFSGPRNFFLKLRPAKHFSFEMWPSDQYELKTVITEFHFSFKC